VHPGVIHTELARHVDASQIEKIIETEESATRGGGQGAVPVEDHPARSRNFGVGRCWLFVLKKSAERLCETAMLPMFVADNMPINTMSQGVRGYAA